MRRRRGEKPLSRDEILRTALTIVDEDGLASLSMRRLGEELDVEAMSIYGHVRSKDDLLEQLVDYVLADVVPIAGDDPVQVAVQLAHAYRAALLAHSNLLPLLARRRTQTAEGGASQRSAALALARSAGLDDSLAVVAYMTIVSFVAGHVMTHLGVLGAAAAFDLQNGPDSDRVFRDGLALIVEGVVARAGQRGDAGDDAVMSAETSDERASRHLRRMTFDAIASEYDTVRPTYPSPMVDRLSQVSGVGPGAPVLEIGCGTGQLTIDLAARGLSVTAIDPGAALIERARERLGTTVDLRVTTFEDLDEPATSFDLIVSASAFHWVDPEIRWTKTASLLRAGGWFALIDTVLTHEPWLADAIMNLWLAHSDDDGAWAKKPTTSLTDALQSSRQFGPVVSEIHTNKKTMRAEDVLGLAKTSAAYLAYSPQQQRSFSRGLSEAMRGHDTVTAELGASLTMARLAQ